MPERVEKRGLSGGVMFLILVLLLLLAMLLSFLLGRYPVPPKELFGIFINRLGFNIEQFWSDTQEVAVFNIRFPRILMAVLVGACLSAAGAAYQGVFQNPMAAPDVLGASAGAGFGAALAIYFGLSGTFITLSAFAMSLLTVALVFFISKRTKGEKVMGMVLAGIIVSSLFQSGTSFIKLVADPTNKLPAITYWLMGSLVGATNKEIKMIILPMIIGILPLILLRWRLNVLTMGDDEAKALGVNPGKLRIVTVISATLVTAAAVSVSGMIGWVGLVIPHVIRRVVGSDYRFLMPASIVGGGLFLLLVDDFSRNIASTEIPIGILTSVIGAPFFLLLITRREETR